MTRVALMGHGLGPVPLVGRTREDVPGRAWVRHRTRALGDTPRTEPGRDIGRAYVAEEVLGHVREVTD